MLNEEKNGKIVANFMILHGQIISLLNLIKKINILNFKLI